MDVILHLGAHRCATTSFQAYLEAHSDALRNHGITAWTPRRTRDGLFHGLMGPSDTAPKDRARAIGRVRLQTAVLARSGTQQLLVSEENLIGTTRTNLRAGRLYPDAAQRLTRISAALSGSVRTLGLAMRSYDSYWASALSYALANGHQPLGTDQLDCLVTQPRRWRDVITDIAAVFPKARLSVWRFEDFAAAPHAQLMQLTNTAPGKRHMTQPDHALNASPNRKRLRDVLAARGQNAALIPDGIGRWMPFDTAQQDAMQAQYADDLAWLQSGADGLAHFAQPSGNPPPSQNMNVIGAISRALGAPPPLFGGHNGTKEYVV